MLSIVYYVSGFILGLTLIAAMSVYRSATEEIKIPGPSNVTLEDYLCSELRTIQPNTTLIIQESQYISSGIFCLVENTTNITINAPVDIRIECLYNSTLQQSRGFGFFNVSGLYIENVHFANCGTFISSSAVRYINASTESYYFGYKQKSVFLFNHCKNVQLSRVVISSYFGYALIGINLCGNIRLEDLEQTNTSFLSQYCSNADFGESGSGSFFYYTDTLISDHICQDENNVLVDIVSKSNLNQCPYPKLQSHFRTSGTIPISGGSSLGLIHAQKNFAIRAQINLLALNNNDTGTIGSTVIVFSSFHKDSIITLSGVYQQNHGTQICVYFRFIDTNTKLPPDYHPLNLKNLTLVQNNFSFFSITIENALSQPSDFTVSVNNVIFQQNNQPQLLYVDGSTTSQDFGIQIEMENITCLENDFNIFLSEMFGVLKFTSVRNVSVLSNTYVSGDFVSSCIQIASSNLFLNGHNITFVKGSAKVGGALQLSDYNSFLYLVEPVHVAFLHNSAMSGSAFYAADALRYDVTPQKPLLCTLQLIVTNLSFNVQNISQLNVSVEILSKTNPSLYATRLNGMCENIVQLNEEFVDGNNSLLPTTILNEHIFSFSNDEDAKLSFVNGFCYSYRTAIDKEEKNCTWMDPGIISLGYSSPYSEISVSTYPGEEFITVFYAYELSFKILEAHDQSYWTLQMQTEYVSNSSSVKSYSFSVSLLDMSVFPEGSADVHILMYQLSLGWVYFARVHVAQCPPGFMLHGNYSVCDCPQLLSQEGLTCDAKTGLIHNPSSSWIGYENGTIFFASECPPARCNISLELDLSIPNYLCENHHSGIICGECAPGYSAVFGSEVCLECSNAWFLTIFLYAISGIFFVFILFALNLTVTTGTICGLVIYSNVLNLSTHIILTEIEGINPIPLRSFIAFLNLDLGFPICFYDGMSTSVKYGLQFIYPVYLWLIVIFLIIACKFSVRLANKLGFACVQVLATLLFFSYSKVLSNVYTILTFQTLFFQSGNSSQIESTSVWLATGQSYAEGSHAALIFFAVFFTALFLLPFTILLTFSFFFVRFRIVNRFLPLIDAYCGPFEEKYRFWFGVRLWVIGLLFFLYTILVNYSISAIYFSHSIVVGGLIVIQAFLKPFRCSVCRLLDLYYLINYWLIAVTCIYLSDRNNVYIRTAVVTFLVSCSFVVFIGILFYQFYQVTKNTRFQKVIKAKINVINKFRRDQRDDESEYASLNRIDRSNASLINETSSKSKSSQKVYDPRHFRDSILDSVNFS